MKKSKALLICVPVMFMWGSLFPVIKLAYNSFSIDASNYGSLLLFAGVRFFICGVGITVFSSARKLPLKIPDKKNFFGILSVGFTAVFLHYMCTYIGLSVTDSSKTALLKQAGALVFICISFVFFKEEKFTVFKIVSAFLGLIGIFALNMDFSNPTAGILVSFGLGEILILVASVCTVAANIFVKKMTMGVPPIVMTGYSQFFGGVLLLALGFITGGWFGDINLESLAIFAYICVASILSYCMWYGAVQKAELSFLLVIKFLEPLFSTLLGALLLKENVFIVSNLIAFSAILGAIMISAFLGQGKPREKQRKK